MILNQSSWRRLRYCLQVSHRLEQGPPERFRTALPTLCSSVIENLLIKETYLFYDTSHAIHWITPENINHRLDIHNFPDLEKIWNKITNYVMYKAFICVTHILSSENMFNADEARILWLFQDNCYVPAVLCPIACNLNRSYVFKNDVCKFVPSWTHMFGNKNIKTKYI